MDARLQHITTFDGLKLYYELWIPNNPKAMVVFVHGLGDHIGRYAYFAKCMLEQGYGVCLYDQRGHGRSAGRRTHARSLNDFYKDLAQIIDMVQSAAPNVPCYLCGHSFGGEIALGFSARFSKNLRGIIALSPLLELAIKVPKWKRWLAHRVAQVVPVARFKTLIDPSWLTHDSEAASSIQKDPLISWDITAKLAVEIEKNLEGVSRMVFQVKVPTFILHGSDDKIAVCEGSRKFYHSLLIQNKDFKIYPGSAHQLLHDTCREKVIKEISAWIGNQLATYARIARPNGGHQHEHKETSVHLYDGSGDPFLCSP